MATNGNFKADLGVCYVFEKSKEGLKSIDGNDNVTSTVWWHKGISVSINKPEVGEIIVTNSSSDNAKCWRVESVFRLLTEDKKQVFCCWCVEADETTKERFARIKNLEDFVTVRVKNWD